VQSVRRIVQAHYYNIMILLLAGGFAMPLVAVATVLKVPRKE
jgi:hypothetical protein